MAISTVSQKGLNAPLTLTAPVLSGNVTATTITSPAATALTLQSAGTTAVTIDTAQKVGLGVSPTTKLDIDGSNYNTATSTTIKVTDHGNNTALNSIQGTLQFRGRYWSGDDNTAVETKICSLKGADDGNTGSALAFYTQLQGSGGSTERMRILNDGAICFGTTSWTGATGISFSNAYDSSIYGKGMYFNSPYNGTRNAVYFAYNGSTVGYIQTGTSTTSYNTSSDYRLKENIEPMTGALEKVALLKPVTYTWKLDGKAGQGFIAHELQEVVPDAVAGEKDAVDKDGKPEYQGVDTSFLVATLTAAIQELNAKVVELEAKLASK